MAAFEINLSTEKAGVRSSTTFDFLAMANAVKSDPCEYIERKHVM